MQFYRLRQCVGWRFSPMPHLSFQFWNPSLCFTAFSKTSVLALRQITICVFQAWNSIQTGLCVGWRFSSKAVFFLLERFRALSNLPTSRFPSRNPEHFWLSSKSLPPVFYPWHSVQLDSASAGDSRPCQFSIFSCVFARLAMCHISKLVIGILIYAWWGF